MSDTFDEAAQIAALFYGTEFTPETLQTFIKIRYPELEDSDVELIVHEALAEN
jgi:hypothetical protein